MPNKVSAVYLNGFCLAYQMLGRQCCNVYNNLGEAILLKWLISELCGTNNKLYGMHHCYEKLGIYNWYMSAMWIYV
jgi:hypothetical protein